MQKIIIVIFVTALALLFLFGALSSNSQPPAANIKMSKKEKSIAVRTKPGRGVKPAQIETLFRRYNPRKGKSIIYLLLNDGSAYRGLSIPPSDFSVKTSKRIEPGKWGKWQKPFGGKYQIRNKDAKWQDMRGMPLQATRHGKRYAFSLKAVSGSSSNYHKNVSVRTSFLTLQRNGRFEFSSTFKHSGVDTAGYAMTAESSTTKDGAYTRSFPGGSKNRSDGKGVGADAVGRYNIGGYTIEFRYDSGRVVRELFFRGDKADHLYIGNQLFYVPEK